VGAGAGVWAAPRAGTTSAATRDPTADVHKRACIADSFGIRAAKTGRMPQRKYALDALESTTSSAYLKVRTSTLTLPAAALYE
jgi:hypothetical protein